MKKVYKSQIREWFKAQVKKEKKTLDPLWNALRSGDEKKIEEIINGFLPRAISIFDIKGAKEEKFYTAFLLGIFLGNPDWGVRAQRESGNGLSDIEIRPEDLDAGIIIETKSMDRITKLDSGCKKAIEQVYKRDIAMLFKMTAERIFGYMGLHSTRRDTVLRERNLTVACDKLRRS